MNARRRKVVAAGLAASMGATLPWAGLAAPVQPGDALDWPVLQILDGATLAPGEMFEADVLDLANLA